MIVVAVVAVLVAVIQVLIVIVIAVSQLYNNTLLVSTYLLSLPGMTSSTATAATPRFALDAATCCLSYLCELVKKTVTKPLHIRKLILRELLQCMCEQM
jgi:hypothetical protein